MRRLNSDEVPAFVAAKPAAALHFDADWNAKLRETTRRTMLEAEAVLGDRANFAEVDCDANVELSRPIPVHNVPLVAYYRDGKLVAALIGAGQNVRARLERVLRGETIGNKDGTGHMQDRSRATGRHSVNYRQIAWRTVSYSAAATAVAWGVLSTLKLRGGLPPQTTWPVVFVAPALAFSLYPALMFWAAWRTRGRPPPDGTDHP